MEIVEVRVNDVQQLFDYRDPAPFRERDLDEDFTNYLEACMDEISSMKPVSVHIHIANFSKPIAAPVIVDAVHKYFEYQIQIKYGQLKKNMRTAQLFLAIGLGILFLCLVIAQSVSTVHFEIVGRTLREGIVIFGWVSLWKPLELILFDWYPIYDRIRIYRRLSKAEIEIIEES